jgi:hypothetical protein
MTKMPHILCAVMVPCVNTAARANDVFMKCNVLHFPKLTGVFREGLIKGTCKCFDM